MPDGRVIAELEVAAQVTQLQEIGRGAAATVYRGRQDQFDRWVAVKILEQPLVEEKSLRRFARECQALGRVSQHPNIVTVHSSGTTPSGYAYIVMEYCGGGSLAARLPAPTSTREVLELGVQLCSALEWAHQARMIHRNIKPANVLLSSLGEPVLADFGIAAVEIGELSLTVHDSLTPMHAAPEVIVHGGGDVRSDVWSLASTLYTLADGRPAFAGDTAQDTLMTMMNRIMQAPLPALAGADAGPLFAALSRAMTKDPQARTPSAAAFGADLQGAQRAGGWPVTAFLGGNPGAPGPATQRQPPTPSARSRRTPLLVVGGVALAAAVIGGGIVLGSGSSGSHPLAAASPTPGTSPPPASPTPAIGETPTPTASGLGAGVDGSSPAPVSTASLPGLPAITTNATTIGKQPTVGTGTLPGPTQLTTRDLIEGSGLAATTKNVVVIREVSAIYGSGKIVAGWTDAPINPTLPAGDISRDLSFADADILGIVGMKPGGRREIVVPSPDLGGADEVFVVDLVSIES